jgi:hypothetical protein
MPPTTRVFFAWTLIIMAAASPLNGQQGTPVTPKQGPALDSTQTSPPKESAHGEKPAAIDSPAVASPPNAPERADTPQPESRPSDGRNESGNESEKKMVWLTGVLCVVAIFQVGLFVWQLSIMQGSLRDSRAAAEAAMASVELAKGTAEQQLRAYLSRSGLTMRQIPNLDGTMYEFWPGFKNAGSTPAYNIRVAGRVELHPIPLRKKVLAPWDAALESSVGPLGGGHLMRMNLRSHPLGPVELELIKNLQWALFIGGQVTYEDIFKHTHRVRFFEAVELRENQDPIGYPQEQHNDAD